MKSFSLATIAAIAAFATLQANAAGLTPQDMMEIEQLYASYNEAIDSNNPEAWADTFTPDGVFANRFNGREALIGFVKTWHEKMNGGQRRHWNNNLRVTGDGKQATASVYLMLLDLSTKPVSIASTGMYSDTLVKTANGWRFSKRTTRGDNAPAAPSPKP